MGASAIKTRDFESYFLEYTLMSSEEEINAFWKRMDSIIASMDVGEKTAFFQQLDVSLKKESEKTSEVLQQVKAALASKKPTVIES